MPAHPPPPKLPPLAAVRVFEAAARHQNFTRAAEELGMTQAAVSYQIRLLEDRVGAPLFVRKPRHVELTVIGQRLAEPVAKALAEIGFAFRGVSADNQNVLTISSLHTLAITWLSPRLTRFQLDHPQFDVQVTTSERLVDFATEDVDLALRYGLGTWPGLVAEKLLACHFAPLCTPETRDRLELREPADLLRAPLLSPREDWWRRWFETLGVDAGDLAGRGSLALQMQAMSIQVAMRGQGVAMAAIELFADDLAAGRLVLPFDHAVLDKSAYWLVYPQERRSDRKIKLFRDWILAEARLAATGMPDYAGMPPFVAKSS